MLADSSLCVVSHDYRPVPRAGQIVPVHLDIGLYEPDTAGVSWSPKSVDKGLDPIGIMRQVEFTPGLLLRMMTSL